MIRAAVGRAHQGESRMLTRPGKCTGLNMLSLATDIIQKKLRWKSLLVWRLDDWGNLGNKVLATLAKALLKYSGFTRTLHHGRTCTAQQRGALRDQHKKM